MQGKIGLEEHFAIPDTINDSRGFLPEKLWGELQGRLLDLQEKRIAEMDKYGVEMMILSLNAPAIQAITDPKMANEIARKANDYLAAEVQKRPDRFRALAALPMQNPELAAKELQRCVKEHGFVGALVNGYSQIGDRDNGAYYDLKQYWPFWAEVEKLDVPFYLHPRIALPSQQKIYEGHAWMLGPAWGFAQETAVHALRLMASGLFDQHPRLNIVLGHMGEGLPFMHVPHRPLQQLGPHQARLPGEEEDRRLFQRQFLAHHVGQFPHPGSAERHDGDRVRSHHVFDRLAVRVGGSRLRLVRRGRNQRGRPAQNRPGQRDQAVQARPEMSLHPAEKRPTL